MVLLHVKRGEESLFLYETSVATETASILSELVHLQNLRLRLSRLVSATEELAQYGPYKPDDEQGYTEEQLDNLVHSDPEKKDEDKPLEIIIKSGIEYVRRLDPTGRRCGEAPVPSVVDTINKTLTDAKVVLSKDLVTAKKCLTPNMLSECIDNIKGAIMIAYPMGLPGWEPVQMILDDDEDLTGKAASKEVLEVENTSLWWASKELTVGKKLMDFIGKNEKTKIIVKFNRKGQGAPVKEAPLTEEAQRNLMAYYYRKQEEEKKLNENKEDDYLNSSWADNRALKSQFNGLGNVKWSPF